MGCGASTVAPVVVEDPLERARRERQEEAERNAERLANQRRVTRDEEAQLDKTPGAWSKLDIFYKHFEDVCVHYRSKYTVFCIQDIQRLVEDCYECFLVDLESYMRASDHKLKNEKPSMLRELVKSNMALYFPGKDRKEIVGGIANYVMTKIGKDGFVTKHQFETLWPKTHDTQFTPGISDAKARKVQVSTISRTPPAPAMPKHVKVSRSIENDTGNDQSQPLTAEETAILRKKPYRWTDPQFFLQHVEHAWGHYSGSVQTPSVDLNTLHLIARDIITNTMASQRTRMRSNFPTLDQSSSEYEKRLNAYIRRVLPVQYKYVYNKVNLADNTVIKDIEHSIVAYFAYYLDFERTGIIHKETFLILFAPLFLRIFDYDQKFTHAHVHCELSAELSSLASNTQFTSGIVAATNSNAQYTGANSRAIDDMDGFEDDALVSRSPQNTQKKVLINLETLPETEAHESEIISPRNSDHSSHDQTANAFHRKGSGNINHSGQRNSMTGSFSSHHGGLPGLTSMRSTRSVGLLSGSNKRQSINRGSAPMVQESVDDLQDEGDIQAFVPRSTRVLRRSNGVVAEKKQSTIDPNNKAVIRAMLLSSPSSTNSSSSNGGMASPRGKSNHSRNPHNTVAMDLYSQQQIREQVVPANVLELLPPITIADLPVPDLWPLLLGAGYVNESTLSSMRPEDIAQPRINARRLSVWDATITNEAMMPLDRTDEQEIDRERLRRLTVYTASLLTIEGLYQQPAAKQSKLRGYISKVKSGSGSISSSNNGMMSGKGEKGTLKRDNVSFKQQKPVDDVPDFDSDDEFDGDEALSRIHSRHGGMGSTIGGIDSVVLRKSQQAGDDDTDDGGQDNSEVSVVSTSESVVSVLHSSEPLPRGKTVDVIEEGDEEDDVVPVFHKQRSEPSQIAQVEEQQGEDVHAVQEESPQQPEQQQPQDSQPTNTNVGYFADLESPCLQNSKYLRDITNITQEVEATQALLVFSDSSVEIDAAILARPPFPRFYPILVSVQEDSGDRFIEGDLAYDFFPEDTSVLLGKTQESKDLRLDVAVRLITHVQSVIDEVVRAAASAPKAVFHNTARIEDIFVADATILGDCVAPLRAIHPELIAGNMMVGKEPQLTNRFLQACILLGYLYRE